MKLDRNVAGQGAYGRFSFKFRPIDLSALQEVLIDQEYGFLMPFLQGKSAPVVADIGGHIGLFSGWCLNINPETRILSVEASPGNYDLLSSTVQHATKKGVHWRAVNYAAWRDGETIRFSDSGDSMSHRVSATGNIVVPGMSLEKIIEETLSGTRQDQVDIMKIDIEGAEEVFLTENPDALNRVNLMVVELHPNLCDTDKIRQVLAGKYPYIEEIQGRKSSKPLLFCRKTLE
ncbi:MAG: FkbM family methyltransferase [Micavibrio sp.]